MVLCTCTMWSGKLRIILLGRGEGGGFMGWVIRDPRIIWWAGRGGFLDPRGSVIRGPPTTLSLVRWQGKWHVAISAHVEINTNKCH